MTPIDRIKKTHVDIMRHKKWCAVSGLLACGKTEVSDRVPTAATNGWDRVYNPKFVESLNDKELRFLVLHEVAGHMAYKHLMVWQKLWKENARLANIAADHFVNLTLVETDGGEGFITMPKEGIQPEPRFSGMSVSQIYAVLKDEGNEQESGGMDDHEWEEAEEHSAEQRQAQVKEIERAMRQGEILRRQRAGKGAGDTDGVFGDLLSPRINWRDALREFVQETCQGNDESSWRKVSRRFLSSDIYMPSMVSEKLGEIVIGFDTSGSCFGGAEMAKFVAEIKVIIEQLKPAKAHIVYWDTQVAGMQTFEDGQFAVQDMKPKGGGGTDGAVLFDYLREHKINPQAVVQFSDGYVGSWGKSDWPTLWALTSNLKSPYGTTLHIGD